MLQEQKLYFLFNKKIVPCVGQKISGIPVKFASPSDCFASMSGINNPVCVEHINGNVIRILSDDEFKSACTGKIRH